MKKIATAEMARGVLVPVEILEEVERFGRIDYLVKPLGGDGSVWLSGRKINNIREERRTTARRATDAV